MFSWHSSKQFIEECKEYNVYSDVAPFKETAVVILDKTNKNRKHAKNVSWIKPGQYINACFIKSAFREVNPVDIPNEVAPYGLIIATQGPKKNTIDHFWSMVMQQNVTRIVTLCKNFGNSYNCDAAQYFPNDQDSVI